MMLFHRRLARQWSSPPAPAVTFRQRIPRIARQWSSLPDQVTFRPVPLGVLRSTPDAQKKSRWRRAYESVWGRRFLRAGRVAFVAATLYGAGYSAGMLKYAESCQLAPNPTRPPCRM